MPRTRWTPRDPADDAVIVEMRGAGATWKAIAQRLGWTGSTVKTRCETIAPHLVAPPSEDEEPEQPLEPGMVMVARTEAPLPVGHALSWGAILVSSQLPLTD